MYKFVLTPEQFADAIQSENPNRIAAVSLLHGNGDMDGKTNVLFENDSPEERLLVGIATGKILTIDVSGAMLFDHEK